MKSILVIDTPNSCSECEFPKIKCGENNIAYKYCPYIETTLYKTENVIPFVDDEFIHPQCPLQDTTELLEALEDLDNIYYKDELSGKPRLKMAFTVEEFSKHQQSYNKLRNALGGNDE